MPVCQYFDTPEGCRQDSCHFLHQASPAESPGDPNGPVSPTYRQPPQSHHVEPESATPNLASSPGGASRQGGGDQTSRAIISQKISATDALLHLEKFCAPRVVFSTPFQFSTFVNLLANAGSKEGSWVSLSSTMDQICITYVDVRICRTLIVFLTWSQV